MRSQPLSLTLKGKQTIVAIDNNLEISFRRTIRVPDNQKISELPPDLGAMNLTNVATVASGLPKGIVEKGGLLLPMHENEAMWINFKVRDHKYYAIKIFVGGVNAISGEPRIETDATNARRQSAYAKGGAIQDYVVVPGQNWLDGVAKAPGLVKQFVVAPLGKGLTVESQITGKEDTGGLQFEITPSFPPATIIRPNLELEKYDCPEGELVHEFFVTTLTGRIICIRAALNYQVGLLKAIIQDKEGIPPDQQRLIYGGRELENEATLKQSKIEPASIIHLLLRLRGGGTAQPEFAEMGLAVGGTIKQTICLDSLPSSNWDRSKSVGFNVQILNVEYMDGIKYTEHTAHTLPEKPISPESYAASGGAFFHLEEKDSDIYGKFDNVKTVGELTGAIDKPIHFPTKDITSPSSSFTEQGGKVTGESLTVAPPEPFDPLKIIPSPKQPPEFRSLPEMCRELTKMWLRSTGQEL
ncbi:hypothetical protein AA313_de0200321 [Arthrobotrys entomopaga]|nr:hypothetical protein AA313_de0200321 [Arthrobotrys entomopaga]